MKKNDETKAIKVKRYKNRMKTADKAQTRADGHRQMTGIRNRVLA